MKIATTSSLVFLSLTGCTTFKYSVSEVVPVLPDKTEKREIGVVFVDASQGHKMACYLTAIFYGGYCWFLSPTEESEQRAKEKANNLPERTKGSNVEVRYIGRN